MGRRPEPALDGTRVRPVRPACHAGGQDDPSPVLQGGKGPTADDRVDARRGRETARSDVLLHELDWTAREILSAYACRWAIECTFENCKQFLGLEDPANRLPKAVVRTAPMALFIYTLVVIWFHQTGHQLLRFPFRPWYTEEGRTIVRRYVDDPEAGQLPGKNPTTASRTVWPENLDRPGHRASQPNRVSDTSTEDPASSTSSRSIRRGEFHPPGRSRTPS